MNQNRKKVLKYLMTGGLTFVAEYSLFILLVYMFYMQPSIAQAISYVLALIINFTLLRSWTFRNSSQQQVSKSLVRYAILVGINLPATTLLMAGLVHFGIAAFIAKIITVGLAAAWNYFVYDNLIFKQTDHSSEGN